MTSTRLLGRFASLCPFGLALALLSGCEPAAPVAPAPATAPADGPAPTEIKSMPVEPKAEGKGAGAAADVKLSDDELAEIKKLPADEQPVALAQKLCPVSDSHLGSMDAPIKQVVNGKTFFLCCAGCEDKVKADPAGVLAKLPK